MHNTSNNSILFILTSEEYVNNYLLTNALDKFLENRSVSFLIPKELSELIPEKYKDKSWFLESDVFNKNMSVFKIYTDVLRWKYRNRSKSFIYREKRFNYQPVSISKLKAVIGTEHEFKIERGKSRGSEFSWSQTLDPLIVILRSFFRKITSRLKFYFYAARKILKRSAHRTYFIIKRYTIRFLALSWITPILYVTKIKDLRPPKELQEIFSMKDFDFVILPSSAFEPMSINVKLALKERNSTYLMIVDNWDNLSSKTVLWELPDYIATWGRQSSKHAVEIQGMAPEKVLEIGTARFSNHLAMRLTKTSPVFDFDYVLFVGTFLEFDELGCLQILSKEIESNPETYGNLHIVYRPHPFTNLKAKSRVQMPNRVILDPLLSKQAESVGRLTLDYSGSLRLLNGAKFVVGGLTSMLIEASLLGKNYLALVHHELNSITSPLTVLKSYTHFENIDELPNVFFLEKLYFIIYRKYI